jgi:hypothetical protein
METTTDTTTTDEHVLAVADGIYRWDGPKRKTTLLSGKLGRLVLTNRRLLFLSSGKHDVTVGKVLAGARGNHLRAGRTDRTDGLDISALANEGSLDLPLEQVRSAELKGMFKFLSVTYDGGASAFAPKNGGMPAGQAWVELIGQHA